MYAYAAPIRLGQPAPPLYTIDRLFATAIQDAIAVLLTETDIPEGWKGEKCWIDLRIRRWATMANFDMRLNEFLKGTAQELQITDEEEILIGEIMICVDTLLQKEAAETSETIEFVSTIIAIIGGLIGVGVAVGLA